MKKRLCTELLDETEPIIKHIRLRVSSPTFVIDEDESSDRLEINS